MIQATKNICPSYLFINAILNVSILIGLSMNAMSSKLTEIWYFNMAAMITRLLRHTQPQICIPGCPKSIRRGDIFCLLF